MADGEVAVADVAVDVAADKCAKTGCSSGYFKRSYSIGLDDIGVGLVRAILAEFLGTFFLILFCVGSANGRVFDTMGTTGPAYFLSIALSFGLGIGGIVHLLSEVSGGHVNPAVSLALFLDKRVSLIKFICYVIAQFVGGFAGAGVLYGLCNQGALVSEDINIIAGANAFNPDMLNTAQAFFIEVFGTMFLILTVLATIEEKRGHAPSYMQPFAIGVAIFIMHIWMIPYTNCAINPVRGTVWNVVAGQAETQTLVFLFAPFVGAIVSVPIYHFILE